jgi:lipopolysaccharide export system permease protein
MATFILTPLALLLTYRATNDISFISMDAITEPLRKTFNKIFKKK